MPAPIPAPFAAYCVELLSSVGPARSKRMFGGHGLSVGDDFIAIVTRDTLYLKTDDETRAQFEAAGGRCFEYNARGEVHRTSYWTVPAEAMDSPDAVAPWARLAIGAARRAAVKRMKKPLRAAKKVSPNTKKR